MFILFTLVHRARLTPKTSQKSHQESQNAPEQSVTIDDPSSNKWTPARVIIEEGDFDSCFFDFVVFLNQLISVRSPMLMFITSGYICISTVRRFVKFRTIRVFGNKVQKMLELDESTTKGQLSSKIVLSILTFFTIFFLLFGAYYIASDQDQTSTDKNNGSGKYSGSQIYKQSSGKLEHYGSVIQRFEASLLEIEKSYGEKRAAKFFDRLEKGFFLNLLKKEITEFEVNKAIGFRDLSTKSFEEGNGPRLYTKNSAGDGRKKRGQKSGRARRDRRGGGAGLGDGSGDKKKSLIRMKPTTKQKTPWNISLEVKKIETKVENGRELLFVSQILVKILAFFF